MVLQDRLHVTLNCLVRNGLLDGVTTPFLQPPNCSLFRQAIQDIVPGPVMERRDKMGFPVPIFEWFKGELRPFVEDILLGETTRRRGFFDMKTVEHCLQSERPFGRTLWGLLSLELWFRSYFDRR